MKIEIIYNQKLTKTPEIRWGMESVKKKSKKLKCEWSHG